jgi:protein gp37
MAMGKRFHKWPEVIEMRYDRLPIPLRTKKPTVFAVWNDLFHEDVHDDFILKAFQTMGAAFHHIYLILTKRPQRILPVLERINPILQAEKRAPIGKVWSHVYLGLTVCNQQEWNVKKEYFLSIPGHKWISHEPGLEKINYGDGLALIDCLVSGGETGPKARPSHPDIFRHDRDQCKFYGVKYFFKQWGEWLPSSQLPNDLYNKRYSGGDEPPDNEYEKYKKEFGRLLDGQEHNELPWRAEL